MRRICTAALGLIPSVFGAGAWAQVSAQDVAMAESLFQKGLAEMEVGNFSEGCPKLAESQRLDPHDGTLMSMADCEDRWGHTATALGLYENYLRNVESMPLEQKKRHAARAKRAAERKKALEPLVPGMLIVLPPNLPPDAKLWRDGRALDLGAAALEVPIDPGEHRVMLQLANGASTEKQVRINAGDHMRVELELPVLENKRPTAESPFLPSFAPPLPALPPSPAPKKDGLEPAPGNSNPYRTWAYVSGSVGLAGLIAGGVLGGLVLKEKGIWEQYCDENTKKCEPEGMEARERAGPYASGSTVGLALGGAFAALGVTLYLLSFGNHGPGAQKPQVSVGVLDAGSKGLRMGVSGTFN